jgi:hypothetical protein
MRLFLAILFSVSMLATGSEALAQQMNFNLLARTPKNEFERLTLNGGRYDIFASGTIAEDTAEVLQDFVKRNGIEVARVHFDSLGGSLIGGIRMGEKIRELGFETSVRHINFEYDKGPIAYCASACAYAFAGGTHRFLSEDVGVLGLHQFYSRENRGIDSSQTQMVAGLILSYLEKMGVNSRAFQVASQAGSDDMVWLSSRQAEEIGLADNGVSPPTAEIKLRDGYPYLRMEQSFNDVISRVLVMCVDGEFGLMAGIVTTPELSQEQVGYFGTSYLYFDDEQYLPITGSRGHAAEGSVVWLDRPLNGRGISLLRQSEVLGIWLNNGGPMQWGTHIQIGKVRKEINEFLNNCQR